MALPAVLRGGPLLASLPVLVVVSMGASEGFAEAGADGGTGRALHSRRLSACPAGPWEAGCPTAQGCLVRHGGVCSCQELAHRVTHWEERAESNCVYVSHIGKWADECYYCGEGFWAQEPLTTFDLAHGRVWEVLGKPIPGRVGSACRGDDDTDNNGLNYEVHSNIMTLESCKARCLWNLPRCKGIEYGPSGRCELWTRVGGLHASVPSSNGYSCHRFGWPVHQLQLADGGTGRACRGDSPADNHPSYYDLTLAAVHLEDCKARCAAAPVCFGLEFGTGGRCEIWTQAIRATQRVPGYVCLRFNPDTLPPIVTTTTTTTVSGVPGQWIIFGPCRLDGDDACVTSPGYPGRYGDRESCTMYIYGDAVKYLDIKDFHTFNSGDRLTFSDGPHTSLWGSSDYIKRQMLGWHISGTVEWSTDGDGRVARGWKLCALDVPPTTTTGTLTSTTTTTAIVGEWVISGPCAVVHGQAECITSPNYPSSYGNGEYCTMSVWGGAGLTKYLWVEDFSTEGGSDWLEFGSNGASGVHCRFHGWEIGRTNLQWSSDSSGVARGWKICARDFLPPTTTTTSTTGIPGTWMIPSSRTCVLDPEDTACVMTKNYPRYEYWNMERCELSLWGDVPRYLEVQGFETQYGNDFLTVNGVQYSGSVGPSQGVLIEGPIRWASNHVIRARGWKICAREIPPSTTTSTSGVPGTWRIQASSPGACAIDPEDVACVATNRYPSNNYFTMDQCELSLWGNVARYLDVQFFETQLWRDVLTVNGQPYSGKGRPPQGELIQGPIRWSTDHSVTARGWKICARESIAVMTQPGAPDPTPAPVVQALFP